MKTPSLVLSTAAALTLAVGTTVFAQPLGPSATLNPSASQMPVMDAMRPEYDAAIRKLAAVQQGLRTKYESSEDYGAIRKELEAVKKDYDAARAKALAGLKDNDEYKRAAEDARIASERVEQARAAAPIPATQPDGTAPIDAKVLDAAQQRMEEGSALTKLEAKALTADKDFTDARTRLNDAWAKMNGVRAKYQTELRADKDWQSARTDLERVSSDMRAPAPQPARMPAEEMAGQGQFSTPAGAFAPSSDWWLYGTAANAMNRSPMAPPNANPTNMPRSGGPSANPGTSNQTGGGPAAAPGDSNKSGGGPAASPGDSNKSGGGPAAGPGDSNKSGGGPAASPGNSNKSGGGPAAEPGTKGPANSPR